MSYDITYVLTVRCFSTSFLDVVLACPISARHCPRERTEREQAVSHNSKSSTVFGTGMPRALTWACPLALEELRDEVRVPFGLADVEKRLDRLRSDLAQWADVAYREGEQLTARVGPSDHLEKKVHLDLGIPEIHRRGLVYPLTWTATGAVALFPKLSADLVLSHHGPSQTAVTLEGTYKPPLGPVGRVADRLVLKRVAEATVAGASGTAASPGVTMFGFSTMPSSATFM